MRRITKRALVFFFGVLFTGFYCEFLIYFVVISQCSWPVLTTKNSEVLKALILADPHLLGPTKSHWFDKMRRESQMHRAFQTIMTWHKPEAVFILGDLFDEGEWSTTEQFKSYVDRFHKVFAISDDVTMHIAVGNHDIGFHNRMRPGSLERFTKALNSSSVQFITLKDNHFVLVNSMAMKGDKCNMCTMARREIEDISDKLKCLQSPEFCELENNMFKKVNYSKPILMQHFPLYRKSDSICTEPDAPPLKKRKKTLRKNIDTLSLEATEYLVSKIKPRAVFGGHTHHGCVVFHEKEDFDFYEYSVPSFSWRFRPDPKYMLVLITPEDYAINKCGLPLETTMAFTAVAFMAIVVWLTYSIKLLGR